MQACIHNCIPYSEKILYNLTREVSILWQNHQLYPHCDVYAGRKLFSIPICNDDQAQENQLYLHKYMLYTMYLFF